MPVPPRLAILTISDRSARGEREDASGPALVEKTRAMGWLVLTTEIIPDELETIKERLLKLSENPEIDLILTTGGTGFSRRDVTPEATQAVITRSAPGISEAMRAESLKITPHAMLSRAMAGMRGRTLIINFPGSPKAALENLAVIAPVIPHAIELLKESPLAEKGHQLE